MPWLGASIALLYWAGVGGWLWLTLGPAAILATSPLILAGGIAAIAAPGFALMVAGVMARESARSAEANAVVLASARMLLEPADHSRDEITAIAQAISKETGQVNMALAETRRRMDALKHDLDAAVTGALKAAEIVRTDSEVLVQKMSSERNSLTQLSEALKNQAEGLARAIPRYAQTMTDAARIAQAEVAKADEALDQRLRSVEDAARRLGERIDQLDTMGAESRKRAQTLASALARMDEQLVQSTRMVDAAVRAGELATAASKSTADALRDAMSDALNGALKTSETIAAQSARSSEDAADALARLKELSVQTEATTRSAMLATRVQADETEQRISQLSEYLFRAAGRASSTAEGGLTAARDRIERASHLVEQIKGGHAAEPRAPSSIDDLVNGGEPIERPRPAPAPTSAPKPSMSARTPVDDADFETALREAGAPQDVIDAHRAALARPAPAPIQASPGKPQPQAAAPKPQVVAQPAPQAQPPAQPQPSAQPPAHHQPPTHPQSSAKPQMLFRPLPDVGIAQKQAEPLPAPAFQALSQPPSSPPIHQPTNPAPVNNPPTQAQRDAVLSWRDLLTGIEEAGPAQREQAANQMVDRLGRAGVKLSHVVRASDLRRIASASHQGERQRRRATRDVAPTEIQRVTRLLEQDSDLHHAARSFIAIEEPEALRVLAGADRAREDAAPRLSAYLLIDAALGTLI